MKKHKETPLFTDLLLDIIPTTLEEVEDIFKPRWTDGPTITQIEAGLTFDEDLVEVAKKSKKLKIESPEKPPDFVIPEDYKPPFSPKPVEKKQGDEWLEKLESHYKKSNLKIKEKK